VQQAQEDEEQDAQQAPEEEQEEELAEVTRATEEPAKKQTESADQLLRAETRTSIKRLFQDPLDRIHKKWREQEIEKSPKLEDIMDLVKLFANWEEHIEKI
jgi:hypothetical protein